MDRVDSRDQHATDRVRLLPKGSSTRSCVTGILVPQSGVCSSKYCVVKSEGVTGRSEASGAKTPEARCWQMCRRFCGRERRRYCRMICRNRMALLGRILG
jgi:hypothetical protein